MSEELPPPPTGRERIESQLQSARDTERRYTKRTLAGLGSLAADLFTMASEVQKHVPLSRQPVEFLIAISAVALTALSALQAASSSREAAALEQALAEDTLRRDQLPTKEH